MPWTSLGVDTVSVQVVLQKRGTSPEQDSEGSNADVAPQSQMKWIKVSSTSPFVPADITFIDKEGVKCDMEPSASALDYFSLYFDDEMMQLLVEATNRYATTL